MAGRLANFAKQSSLLRSMINSNTILVKGDVPLPIEDEILQRIRQRSRKICQLIVPTQEAAQKLHRYLLSHVPNSVATSYRISTFENFVRHVYRSTNSKRKLISPELQNLFFSHILQQNPMPLFQSRWDRLGIMPPIGTISHLSKAIAKLKRNAVLPETLRANVKTRDGLNSIIAIYEAYQDQLGEVYIDQPGIYTAVSDVFSQINSESVHKQLKPYFQGVDLVVLIGFETFFPIYLKTLISLSNLPGISVAILLDIFPENEELFGHVKKSCKQLLSAGFDEKSYPILDQKTQFELYLFNNCKVIKRNLTHRITFISAKNRINEVEFMAKEIKRLRLAQPELQLDQVCITFYQLPIYAPLIREIFPIYGIPFALEFSTGLASSPIVINIINLLENQKVESITPEEFRAFLNTLIQESNIAQNLIQNTSGQNQNAILDQEIGAYQRLIHLIDELTEFSLNAENSDCRHPISHYINSLRLMISQSTYPLKKIGKGGVQVLPISRTKMLDFDVVFLGGLVDGEFPETFRPDPFLPPQYAGTEYDRLREDRLLFYQTLKMFRHHLYLTSPQHDGQLELVRSSFIDGLQRIVEINIPKDFESDIIYNKEQLVKYIGKKIYSGCEISIDSFPIPAEEIKQIAHHVDVEMSRGCSHTKPEYEGSIIPSLLVPESQLELAQSRQKLYSITQLEMYGKCPFQYFTTNVLRLRQPEDENEQFPSLEKGDLLHRVLYEYFDQRRDRHPISNCDDPEFSTELEDLRTIAKKHLNKLPYSGLFWEIEKERILGSGAREGILPRFLTQERNRHLDVKPKFFEVAFGQIGRGRDFSDRELVSSESIQIGDVNIFGKIDRIELGEDFFVIGDYKTGKQIPRVIDIVEGRSLQLPIYLAVTKVLLEKKGFKNYKGVAGVYYILDEDGKTQLGCGDQAFRDIAFDLPRVTDQLIPNRQYQDIHNLDDLIGISTNYVTSYVQEITSGKFPTTHHEKKDFCRHCSFKQVCRIGAIEE